MHNIGVSLENKELHNVATNKVIHLKVGSSPGMLG